MEEIRLKMTLEAAGKLEKKGFSIETERLEKVVEELRKLEESYYRSLLKEADADTLEQSVQLLKETTQNIESLKYIPCYVLGSTLSLRNSTTIPSLLSEGMKLQAEFTKAGTAYETLMTVPNSEYGDSMKRAFANMDSLLREMNIENTEQNKRAVRILGYNQMEISQETIDMVKDYDLQMNSLIQNLHPAVTVRMIREGIDPLQMPVSELNRTIDRIKEEQGITAEEKFSTYLRNLEKTDGISKEERKAYIGIYRLLYNVEKSDGAALGSVIKAGREVTLEHLLSALLTGKKGALDTVVNDEFGTLQSISHSKETITEQLSFINSRFNKQDTVQERKETVTLEAGDVDGKSVEQAAGQGPKEITETEQGEYLNRILKLISEEISPQKLKEAGQSAVSSGTVQSKAASAPSQSSERTIWDSIKDQPVDKLLEQLRDAKEEQVDYKENYTQKINEIRELCRTSEQAIRFLNDFEIPGTPQSILLANHILSNGESPVKKLLKIKNENNVENSENSLKELNEITDKLNDKHSMEEVFEQLETDAKTVLNKAYSEEKIDFLRLAELKSIGQQVTFLRTLAGKEFYRIPIETDNVVTNMNLTILRGTGMSGKVSVTVWSGQLGNIKADFTLKDKALKGFISSDSRNGLDRLKENSGEIETAARENGVTLKSMDFSILRRDSETYSYQNHLYGSKETSSGNDNERTLYGIAKAVVRTVVLAQNSGKDLDLAVS
jgi:hypothetical protein